MDNNSRYKKLTILHSNDMHGDFLPELMDDKLMGGVARLSGYINQVRRSEQNVLYCMAGDMFSGSVIDSEYKGISTIEIMNMLAPDVVTIGNHEVDYGIGHLLFLEKLARFSIINANMRLRFNNTRLFTPCKVFNKGGMKIMVIGVLTEQTLAQTKKESLVGKVLCIDNPIEEIEKICSENKKDNIDLTILLTHIGIADDIELAKNLKPEWGVDLIIGGHSHTYLEEPVVVNGIPIVQAGWGTDQVGRCDIVVDTQTNTISEMKWQPVPITEETCPIDEQAQRVINIIKNMTDAKYERVVTHLDAELTHPRRNMQTSLGGFFADVMKEALGTDIMLLASGSVRTQMFGPTVTFANVVECFPFKDKAYQVKINGAMLKKMLLRVYRDEAFAGSHTEFYQLSKGLKVIYNRSEHAIKSLTFEGEEVTDDRQFTVGLQEYHFFNVEDSFGLTMEDFEGIEQPRCIGYACNDIALEYLEEHPNISADLEDRLIIE